MRDALWPTHGRRQSPAAIRHELLISVNRHAVAQADAALTSSLAARARRGFVPRSALRMWASCTSIWRSRMSANALCTSTGSRSTLGFAAESVCPPAGRIIAAICRRRSEIRPRRHGRQRQPRTHARSTAASHRRRQTPRRARHLIVDAVLLRQEDGLVHGVQERVEQQRLRIRARVSIPPCAPGTRRPRPGSACAQDLRRVSEALRGSRRGPCTASSCRGVRATAARETATRATGRSCSSPISTWRVVKRIQREAGGSAHVGVLREAICGSISTVSTTPSARDSD